MSTLGFMDRKTIGTPILLGKANTNLQEKIPILGKAAASRSNKSQIRASHHKM